MDLSPLTLASSLVCLFFAVCFLQSGLDKISDRKGNLEWLTGHFANTPFKNQVPVMLTVVTLMECAAGVVSLVGAVGRLWPDSPIRSWAAAGMLLSAATLLVLFAGQRIAKDYPGASTLAIYFGVAILGVMLT